MVGKLEIMLSGAWKKRMMCGILVSIKIWGVYEDTKKLVQNREAGTAVTCKVAEYD